MPIIPSKDPPNIKQLAERLEKLRDIELEEACGEHLMSGAFFVMARGAERGGSDWVLVEILDEAKAKYKESSDKHLEKAVAHELERRALIDG